MRNKTVAALLAVLAFTFVIRIPAMFEYLAWDEGNYAYVASGIIKGSVPYKDMPLDKEPAILLLYAGIFKFIGETSFSVRLIGALWVCLTAFLIFLLGRRLAGNAAGLIAAFFYGLSMAGILNCGIRTNTEVFMGLFSVLAYASAFAAAERKKPAYLFLAGLAIGLNISLKLSAVMDLAGVVAFVTLASLFNKGERGRLLKRFSLILLGLSVALLPFVSYIAYKGALKEAWGQVFMWRFANLGVVAKDAAGPLARLKESLAPVMVDEAGLFTAAALSLAGAVVFRRDRRTLLLVLWLCFSFAAVSMTGRFIPYYYPFIVPPLALLAGYGLSRPLEVKRPWLRAAATLALSAWLIGSAALFFAVNKDYFLQFGSAYSGLRKGELSEYEFHRALQADVLDSYDAARYVRENTSPSEFVFFWVDSGEFYWQAKRRPSVGLLSPIPPGRDREEEARLKKAMYDGVVKNAPAYFVVRDAYMMYTIPPFRSTSELSAFKELDGFLVSNYQLEKVTGRAMIYRKAGKAGPGTMSQVFFPEFMKPSAGYLDHQDWFMYSDGSFSADFSRGGGSGPTRFTITARGAKAGGVYPHIAVYIDGKRCYEADIAGTAFEEYSFVKELSAGVHNVIIRYDKGAHGAGGGEGRNLYFRDLVVAYNRAA